MVFSGLVQHSRNRAEAGAPLLGKVVRARQSSVEAAAALATRKPWERDQREGALTVRLQQTNKWAGAGSQPWVGSQFPVIMIETSGGLGFMYDSG